MIDVPLLSSTGKLLPTSPGLLQQQYRRAIVNVQILYDIACVMISYSYRNQYVQDNTTDAKLHTYFKQLRVIIE